MNPTKTCSKCGETKALELFHKGQSDCKECAKARTAAWRKANADKVKAQRAAYRKENADKVKARETAWRKANADKVKAQSAAYYKENADKVKAQSAAYRKENADKVKARETAWYKANADKKKAKIAAWYKANADKVSAQKAAYRKENADKVNAKVARRKAAKLKRIPPWADKEKTQSVYTMAKMLSTKECPVHVDHIIPLQSKLVSGFDEHTNLQIITASTNVRKKNRFTPVEFRGLPTHQDYIKALGGSL